MAAADDLFFDYYIEVIAITLQKTGLTFVFFRFFRTGAK